MVVEVSLLLELVQQYPFLYDKKRQDFKDLQKKKNVWLEIADILDCEVEEVKTRWRTLRERYARETKLQEVNTKSGQSQEDSLTKWEWFDAMSFLATHIKARKTCNSQVIKKNTTDEHAYANLHVHVDLDDIGNSVDSLLSPSSQSSASIVETHTPTVTKLKRKCVEEHVNIEKEMLKTIQALEKPQTEDEDEIFCKGIACELRKITDMTEKQKRKETIYLVATGVEI